MDKSQEPFYAGIYRKKCRRPSRAADFVRACAVEMHMDISREPFYARIDRKNPDQAPALPPTVRTPQCGHTVWGMSQKPGLKRRPSNSWDAYGCPSPQSNN